MSDFLTKTIFEVKTLLNCIYCLKKKNQQEINIYIYVTGCPPPHHHKKFHSWNH